MSLAEQCVSFERGEMTDTEAYAFFQRLVDSGDIDRLPGSYRLTAASLLDDGLILPGRREHDAGVMDEGEMTAYFQRLLDSGLVEEVTEHPYRRVARNLVRADRIAAPARYRAARHADGWWYVGNWRWDGMPEDREPDEIMAEGLTLAEAGQTEQAITATQDATASFRHAGDRHREARALLNLGQAFQAAGRLKDALAAYEESVTAFAETGDMDGESTALAHLKAIRARQA